MLEDVPRKSFKVQRRAAQIVADTAVLQAVLDFKELSAKPRKALIEMKLAHHR